MGIRLTLLLSLIITLFSTSGFSQSIACGDSLAFTKANFADVNLAENQDSITASVILVRGSRGGLYNIKQDTSFNSGTSPSGTEWAIGTTDNLDQLTFGGWNTITISPNQNRPVVDQDLVLHIVEEDIYIDIRFTDWTMGNSNGGGYSYTRSTISVDGGNISTNDATTICVDGSPDPIDVTLEGNYGPNSAWVITDTNGMILGLPPGSPFDLDGAGGGVCLIWHLSFEDGLSGAEVGLNAADLQGCFDLSNPISVVRNEPDGGVIRTDDPTTICLDSDPDPITVQLDSTQGANSAWVVTDTNGMILGLPPSNVIDLNSADPGVCLIWHLSFFDTLVGADVGSNANDLQGCFDLSNPIAVNRVSSEDSLSGGTISTTDNTTICVDGNPDPINVTLEGNLGPNSAWVITDTNGTILGLPPGPPFDLDGAGGGVCLIWHLSFADGLVGAEVGLNANDLGGCFDLSNPITVIRNEPDGGVIRTDNPTTICLDSDPDPITVQLDSAQGANSAWVVTDTNGIILGLPPSNVIDLNSADSGVCLIWHLSFFDTLIGAEVGSNANNIQGCFDLSNPIAVNRINSPDTLSGGTISTTDNTAICVDGTPDPINVTLEGNLGPNSAWVITDTNGMILGLPPGPPFDLDGAGGGVCLIWHLSFADGLNGAEVGLNANDLGGCFDLSNPIAVIRNEVDGGTISTNDPTTICVDGMPDPIDVTLTGNLGSNSAWVITDTNGTILGLPPGPPFDLDGAGGGVCLIWHISFADSLTGAEVGLNAIDLQGCFDLSNPITVIRNEPNGGVISTDDPTTICLDSDPDPITVQLDSAQGANSAWVVTDTNGMILGLPPSNVIDLNSADPGVCLIWHLSFFDTLVGAEVGSNANDLQGCFDLSNPIAVNRISSDDSLSGGTISTADNTTICVDGMPDPIDVTLTGNLGPNSAWVITDTNGTILGLPQGPPFDLDGAGGGVCLIWHLSFADGLVGAEVGLNANDLGGCFDLSNPITVIRNEVDGGIISTDDPTTICLDSDPDPITVQLDSAQGANSAWVVTDTNGMILGLPPSNVIDLNGADPGVCLIWHLSYSDTIIGAQVGLNAGDLQGCFDLSNAIAINRVEGPDTLSGGTISTTDETTICANGVPDPIDVTLEGNLGPNSAWVITDTNGTILGLPPGPPFDLDGAGGGVCLIWHLSFADGLTGAEVGLNAGDLQGCFDLSNPITVTRNEVNGGTISTSDERNICIDSIPDLIDVNLEGNIGDQNIWVITNGGGNIIALPDTFPFDFNNATAGVCFIYNISYLDTISGLEIGNDIANDLTGCFSRSNSILVNRSDMQIFVDSIINVRDNQLGGINITIFNGVGPFNYNWSNGDTTQDLSNVEAGFYSLSVTDAIGCTKTFGPYEVMRSNNTNTINSISTFDVSPNPAQDFTWVEYNLEERSNVDINIYNAVGTLMESYRRTAVIQDKLKVNTSKYLDGLYFIQLKTKNGVISKKLIIK